MWNYLLKQVRNNTQPFGNWFSKDKSQPFGNWFSKDKPQPLGRWLRQEKPYVNLMYDNCYGVTNERDRLEYETYTRGCVFVGQIHPYCQKCFGFLPKNKNDGYIVDKRLHESHCLIKRD